MAPNNNSLEKQTWGTWEELLLACAVHRHGTESWDSVAMEVRKRSSGLALLLTPQSCRQKYLDLERRFNRSGGNGGGDPDNAGDGVSNIPWLDELKRLRVAELKRELERYDLSIVSLQLKVKRLKDAREQSSREIEKDTEKSDLEGSGEEEKDGDPSPESFAGKPDPGQDCARDNQSVNESNSTDPKHENPETEREDCSKEPDPVQPEAGDGEKIGAGRKSAGEDSYNGSTETVTKESPAENSGRRVGDSTEVGESVAESKGDGRGGEGEGTKDSSDVQSSVSLSRKKEQEPDEPDNEDQSPAIKRVPVQSQPFADFVGVLRSHKYGPLFERRLDSQEKPNYTNLIRQHMDLEKVEKRLEGGWYSGCKSKFFRDLLLLLNNAIVFYGNKSTESIAAMELRRLVSKEMAKSDNVSNKKPAIAASIVPASTSSKQGSVKPKLSIPIVACRKRSSIATKANSGAEKRKEQQTSSLVDEKPVVGDLKQQDKSCDNVEDAQVAKKRSRERSSTSGLAGKNSNKNSKSRDNTSKNSDNTNSVARGGSNSENVESKQVETEKKTNTNASGGKKRSAANFLNRMKQSSTSTSGSLVDTLKTSVAGNSDQSGKAGSDHQNKNANTKADSRRDQPPGKKGTLVGKQPKEQESPGKRRIGRPPKRAAAPPPAAASAKRNRESGETEAPVASRNAKKRSKK